MSKQDHIDALVRKALWFDRLREMGMIGPTGKKANAEACRRNAWIRNKQKELGITSTELAHLKIEAIQNGELY
jgi:hypothetical protein